MSLGRHSAFLQSVHVEKIALLVCQRNGLKGGICADISKAGDELVSYMGPAPPIGVHRYIFILFKQSQDVRQHRSFQLQSVAF